MQAAAKDSGVQGSENVAAPSRAARVDLVRVAPQAFRAQFGLEAYVRGAGLESALVQLVRLRASYMNGCSYCVDMHTKDARLAGESEQRLYAIPVWRETRFFTPRERAALVWTEAVTEVRRTGVPDWVYEVAREQFDETELVALTMAIVAINGWNRLEIAFRVPVGDYVAGSVARLAAAVFA
jgi:AhpD family alkylhydroperoxidase